MGLKNGKEAKKQTVTENTSTRIEVYKEKDFDIFADLFTQKVNIPPQMINYFTEFSTKKLSTEATESRDILVGVFVQMIQAHQEQLDLTRVKQKDNVVVPLDTLLTSLGIDTSEFDAKLLRMSYNMPRRFLQTVHVSEIMMNYFMEFTDVEYHTDVPVNMLVEDFILMIQKHQHEIDSVKPSKTDADLLRATSLHKLLKKLKIETKSLDRTLLSTKYLMPFDFIQTFEEASEVDSRLKRVDDDLESTYSGCSGRRSESSHVSGLSGFSENAPTVVPNIYRSSSQQSAKINGVLSGESVGQSKVRRAAEAVLSKARMGMLTKLKDMLVDKNTDSADREHILPLIHALLEDGINQTSSKSTNDIIKEVVASKGLAEQDPIRLSFLRKYHSLFINDDNRPEYSKLQAVTFLAHFGKTLKSKQKYFFPEAIVSVMETNTDNKALGSRFEKQCSDIFEELAQKVLTNKCNAYLAILRDIPRSLASDITDETLRYHIIASLIVHSTRNKTIGNLKFEETLKSPEQKTVDYILTDLAKTCNIPPALTNYIATELQKLEKAEFPLDDTPKEFSRQDEVDFKTCFAFVIGEQPRQLLKSRSPQNLLTISELPRNRSLAEKLSEEGLELAATISQPKKSLRRLESVAPETPEQKTPDRKKKTSDDFDIKVSPSVARQLCRSWEHDGIMPPAANANRDHSEELGVSVMRLSTGSN